MKGIENVFYKTKMIALVCRGSTPVNDIKFLTKSENPFQIGLHDRKKGVVLTPHTHKVLKPLIINTIQEILYVVSGKIRITLYTRKGETISKKILSRGDSILLVAEGHGVEFLQKSRIFEVKQGPYPGPKLAKNYFKEAKQ